MKTIEPTKQAPTARRSAGADIAATVAQILQASRDRRREFADERTRQGAALGLSLRQNAAARKQRVAVALAAIAAARAATSAEACAARTAAVATLRVATAAQLGALRAARFQSAAQRARRIATATLAEDTPAPQLTPSPRLAAAVDPPASRAGDNPSPEPPPAAHPRQGSQPTDDFTAIWGVGPATQQRLNRAGIHTYAQLAQSAPSALRRALGDAMRLNNVEQWIEQARDLAALG